LLGYYRQLRRYVESDSDASNRAADS